MTILYDSMSKGRMEMLHFRYILRPFCPLPSAKEMPLFALLPVTLGKRNAPFRPFQSHQKRFVERTCHFSVEHCIGAPENG